MSAKLSNDATYSLHDLKDWSRPGIWLAVLGHPIAHSLSPHMHNSALEELALEDSQYSDWNYIRFDIPIQELPQALDLLHAKKFRGVNLTIPHKVEALPLVDRVDPDAQSIGAINTLWWRESGYVGFNTDGYGMETAIKRNLQTRLWDLPVVLFGAGGAARAAAMQCLIRGCPEIWIGNRSEGRLNELVGDILRNYPESKIHPFLFDSSLVPLPEEALIINATSMGLKQEDSLPMDISCFSEKSVFFDMIYTPPQTVMMRAFGVQGVSVCNGLDMLVYQGARALEIWTGLDRVPEDAMRKAALSA